MDERKRYLLEDHEIELMLVNAYRLGADAEEVKGTWKPKEWAKEEIARLSPVPPDDKIADAWDMASARGEHETWQKVEDIVLDALGSEHLEDEFRGVHEVDGLTEAIRWAVERPRNDELRRALPGLLRQAYDVGHSNGAQEERSLAPDSDHPEHAIEQILAEFAERRPGVYVPEAVLDANPEKRIEHETGLREDGAAAMRNWIVNTVQAHVGWGPLTREIERIDPKRVIASMLTRSGR